MNIEKLTELAGLERHHQVDKHTYNETPRRREREIGKKIVWRKNNEKKFSNLSKDMNLPKTRINPKRITWGH